MCEELEEKDKTMASAHYEASGLNILMDLFLQK